MIKALKPIKYGTRPKVVLLGNGINRAHDNSSWDRLIEKISCDERSAEEIATAIEEMPNPLAVIVATNGDVKGAMEACSGELTEFKICEKGEAQIRRIVALNPDAIITTNYTYEIEKAVDDNFYIKPKRTSKYRNKTRKLEGSEEENLLQYINVSNDDSSINVWHMHGEAAKPNSMIIGHYYYGRLLSKIQRYVTKSCRAYHIAEANECDFQPYSWIDYFLFGDIYIIGQGLDYSEIILWWLINCKKLRGIGKVTWFDANTSISKKLLANTMGIEVIEDIPLQEKDYISYYDEVIKRLQHM